MKSTKEIMVGAGEAATNNGVIVSSGNIAKGERVFEWVKRGIMGKSALNICSYGMVAMEKDTAPDAQEGYLVPADNATLTNNGSVTLHYKDIAAAFKEQLKIATDRTRKYDAVFAWGMFAGKNSKLINNGDLNLVYDEEDADATCELFSHPMYTGPDSAMINNGTVTLTGSGSAGANVHGINAGLGDKNVRIENNGTLHIDVARTFSIRALTTTETGVDIINSGSVYAKGDSTVWAIFTRVTKDTSGINTGKITAISEGRLASPLGGMLFPFMPGAFAISGGANPGTSGSLVNHGILRACVQGEAAAPYAVANGILVYNSQKDGGVTTVINTGTIEVPSSVKPCAENQNIVRVAELGINSFSQRNGEFQTERVKIKEFATTLRDFAKTKDFIQAYKAVIDVSEMNLILRPADGYEPNTAYTISKDTLVTKIFPYYVDYSDSTVKNVADRGVSDYEVSVIGMGSVKFTSADDEHFAVNVTKTGEGDETSYSVSLSQK